ncbi:hypothetical protein [Nocardiopsis gilva]|uniref:hypothetical protein n=1 Tax=Nocardiopsis gilva TaxID=280236 RepID=UPI0012688317|nr:hypothetical protein [Nocardiopsis gilva]
MLLSIDEEGHGASEDGEYVEGKADDRGTLDSGYTVTIVKVKDTDPDQDLDGAATDSVTLTVKAPE